MIKSAQKRLVSEILGIDAHWKFMVPRYQREYVWRRDHWEHLFDDLWENPPGYFLGSMICINRSDDAMQVQDLEVVDGQQRLATLSLLYAAIHRCLVLCEPKDDDAEHEIYNLRHRLVFQGQTRELRLDPSYQGQNYADYRAILQEAGILKNVEKPANAGNRLLFKAYRFFINRLDELDDKGSKVFDPECIRKLLECVNKAALVKIEVGSHADAFTLFESLNNRGEPLSALDLIKNNLLAALEKRKYQSLDENFQQWQRLLAQISDDSEVQHRFLRQYYNAFKGNPQVAVKSVPRATRSTLIRIYEELVSRDPVWLSEDLFGKSLHYNRLINPENEANTARVAQALLDLDRIGGAASYTLLLHLLSTKKVSDKALAAIAEFLVRYFVRRNLTDVPPTRDLDTIFMELIDATENLPAGESVDACIAGHLQQPVRCASDEVFASKLSGNIYDENTQVARFVLCKIEESHQTREHMTDLWERDEKDRFLWTVEHIFPQGSNIPEPWVAMIADGDHNKAQEIRDQAVHKLGNLTLSAYNSKLGTMSFEQKQDRKDQQGRHVGYQNGLFLNECLRTKKTWTARDIEERTDELAAHALKLFSLKHGPARSEE